MFFEYPRLLWLLVIPALLVLHYVYIERSGRRPHMRVSTAVPWKKQGRSFMTFLRHVPGHGCAGHSEAAFFGRVLQSGY